MITLIDKYGFVKQLNIALPPNTPCYQMACFPQGGLWEQNAAYSPSVHRYETRIFYRQGYTTVFEER